MSARKTLVIALIFILAGGLYWWDQRRIHRKEAQEQTQSRLVAPPRSDLTEVVLRHEGREIRLAKAGDRWRMEVPVAWGVEPSSVESLLDQIDQARRNNRFEATEARLADYGLTTPTATLEVRAAARNYVETIQLGETTPSGNEVYARAGSGRDVFTVPLALVNQVKQTPQYYRDKRILPLEVTRATSLTLQTERGRFALEKRDGAWKLVEPMRTDADQTKIEDLLRELSFARAEDFVDAPGDPAAFGLQAPAWSAMVYAPVESGATTMTSMTLWVGDVVTTTSANRRYARREGATALLAVAADLPVRVNPTLDDLRDKKLFKMTHDQVSTWTLVVNGKPIELVRDEQNQWRLRDDPQAKLDQATVNAKLTSLLDLKASRYLTELPSDDVTRLDAPILRISLATKDGRTSTTVITGRRAENEDYVYARRLDTGEAIGILWTEPGRFILSRDDFLDKRLLDFAEDEVRRFVLVDGTRRMTFTRADTHWTMQPEGSERTYSIEPARVSTLLYALSGLQWSRRLNQSQDRDAGLIVTHNLAHPAREIILYGEGDHELGRLGQGQLSDAAGTTRDRATTATATDAGTTPTAAAASAEAGDFVYVRTVPDAYFAVDRSRYAGVRDAIEALLRSVQQP